jgi:Asp/Glu/hydantoin racemase
VEAEAATLMGQLVWDASQRRDHATAHMYLDQAMIAAQQCQDPAAEGLALLRKSFNDAKRAQPILEETAQSLHDRSKSQAIVLGNLTLACIRQGKLDEATARLHEAVDVIELTWSGGRLNIVFGAGRELRPWRCVPVVQDAYDRLLSLMAAA